MTASKPRTWQLFLVAGLVGACGEAPITADTIAITSQSGSTEAQVHFDGGLRRGMNRLSIELAPVEPDEAELPQLEAVEAVMATHAHVVRSEQIEATTAGFRAPLDLFMSGRWQIELALRSGTDTDSVSFPIDVP